jgi:hypothetical protein
VAVYVPPAVYVCEMLAVVPQFIDPGMLFVPLQPGPLMVPLVPSPKETVNC